MQYRPWNNKHLYKDCAYTNQVWGNIKSWFGLQALPSSSISASVYGWWKKCRIQIEKRQRPAFDGLIIFFWWNVWKERKRRIFNNETKTIEEAAFLIKEDFQQYILATRQSTPQQGNWALFFSFSCFCVFQGVFLVVLPLVLSWVGPYLLARVLCASCDHFSGWVVLCCLCFVSSSNKNLVNLLPSFQKKIIVETSQKIIMQHLKNFF